MLRKNSANLIVRESITHALFKLMKKKKLRDITVSELVQTAGVSRNSFYRNYESMEDIIRQYLRDETAKWWNSFPEKPPKHVFTEIFHFLYAMNQEIDLIYKAGLSHMLMDLIILCSKEEEPDDIDLRSLYQNAANAGTLWCIINEWIQRGMKESPTEMENIIYNKQ